jgi:hypothetical protein
MTGKKIFLFQGGIHRDNGAGLGILTRLLFSNECRDSAHGIGSAGYGTLLFRSIRRADYM